MKFTLTINQAGATIAGLADKLDIIDLAIFDAFKDFANGSRCEKKFEQNRVWFWISYQALVKEIPFVPIKTKNAVYRRMKKLAEANIIEFHPGNQKTGKAFFAWSANYDHLNGRDFTEDELKMLRPKPTDGKPDPYGQPSAPPTDGKPDNQYTNNQSIKPKRKKSAKNADGVLPLEDIPSEGEKPPIPAAPPIEVPKRDTNDPRPHLKARRQNLLEVLAVTQNPVARERIINMGQLIRDEIALEDGIDRVLTLLNEKGGFVRGLKLTTADNRRPVRKRLKTDKLEDVLLVVESKCREWKDTSMREHLHPDTLMNGKFEKYLNAALLDKQSPLTPKDGQAETSGFPQNIPVYGR